MTNKNIESSAAVESKPPNLAEAISVIKAKIALAMAAPKPPVIEKGKPNSRVSFAERAEVMRLHLKGYHIGEIASVMGRPRGTIGRVIKRHGKPSAKPTD